MPLDLGKTKTYRRVRQTRAAHSEPGTMRQQLLAVAVYLDAQADERRTGYAAERLWHVCHSLACDRAIVTSSRGVGL